MCRSMLVLFLSLMAMTPSSSSSPSAAFVGSSATARCSSSSVAAQKNADLLLPIQTTTGTQKLNIRLDVGQTKECRMSIQGLLVELLPEAVEYVKKNKQAGNASPASQQQQQQRPDLSNVGSAVRRQLKVLQRGHFIGMNGANYLNLQGDDVDVDDGTSSSSGSWEVIWREGADAGILTCTLAPIVGTYRRNDAVLRKGTRLCISFPVWTREGLTAKQDYKRKYEDLVKQHKMQIQKELSKMEATGNWLEKAWHFRNAAAAAEDHNIIPRNKIAQIPMDHEIIRLFGIDDDNDEDDEDDDNRLLLSNKGLVWEEGHFGRQVLLGSAVAKAASGETTTTTRRRNKVAATATTVAP